MNNYISKYIPTLIKNAIVNHKQAVIDTVLQSKINVSNDISDKDLFDLIFKNIEVGNGFLIVNLSVLLDKIEKNTKGEKKSGFIVTAIVTGATLLYKGISSYIRGSKEKYQAKQDAIALVNENQNKIRLSNAVKKNTLIINDIVDTNSAIAKEKNKAKLKKIQSILTPTLIIGVIATVVIFGFVKFVKK